MPESPLQVRVREAIAALGGYWQPANAAIRLLEELGELAEHALDPLARTDDLAGECADLWIISTAIADQFYGFVDEPQTLQAPPVDGAHQLAELVAAGGRVGRIVNHYDGPKTPRSFDSWISLEQAVAALHRHLIAYSATHGVDLLAAVERTLDRNVAVDAGRFTSTYDARTAPSLERYAAVTALPAYPFPGETRLFGAPDWLDTEWRANLDAIGRPLTTFTRAAAHEHLDGFVIAGPPNMSTGGLTRWADRLATALDLRRPGFELHRFSPLSRHDAPDFAPNEPFLLVRRSR